MRAVSSYIKNLWNNGGPFIGPDRPHARVTVEPSWRLNTTADVATSDPSKLPFRWWQRLDNSQVEIELPNIKSISWDRSIDSDSASCNISVYNQKMDPNLSGQNTRLGTRGYYTWRPRSDNARAHWPENVANEWTNILVPNALLRTYEGYGGHGKTIAQAVNDGNLLLTGVWLIDRVDTAHDGMMTLQCRDMCKLLIEQQLYLPLMPAAKYPLKYRKWIYEYTIHPAVPYYDLTNPVESGPGSEGPKWVPEIAMTSDGDGYYVLGTDGGVFAYDAPFYGSRGQGAVGMTVSIDGKGTTGYWVLNQQGGVFTRGDATNFGSPSPLYGNAVQLVATSTGNGYWILGDDGTVYAFGDAPDHGGFPITEAKIVSMAARSDNGGYVLLAEDGAVYAYGSAGYIANAPIGPGNRAVGIAMRPQNDGYWIVAADGAVFGFGNALFQGRVTNPNKPIREIHASPDGTGYWLLGEDGGVFAFNPPGGSNAGFHGSSPPTTLRVMSMGIGTNGYWLMSENGSIYAYNVPYHGNPAGGVDNAPMRGLDVDPLGRGYWIAAEDGGVFAFGESGFYGSAAGTALSAPIVRLVAYPDGRGYWLLGEDGGVFDFPAPGHPSRFYGSAVGVVTGGAVDMACTSTGLGYFILGGDGGIFAFGDAVFRGSAVGAVAAGDRAEALGTRPQDDGYWIVTGRGEIARFGAAGDLTPQGAWATLKANLNDPITGIDVMPTGNGFVLVGGDGGVFSFGDAPFEGSLPAQHQSEKRFPGEYEDLVDIIKDLLLWAGWLLYGTNDVFGNLESTGTYIEQEIPADNFDKKAIIDAINVIRDIVGYEFWVDEEGGARFESANWYTYGNFMQETGLRTGQIPEINEKNTLISYSQSFVDSTVRSNLILTSFDPTQNNETTITTDKAMEYPADFPDLVRGMVRPAMIPVPITVTRPEQEEMFTLINRHAIFSMLQGSLSCPANPQLQPNDQVWVTEQVSGDTDVHFIRGISSNHDLDTGEWTYQLTVNRFGNGREAALTGLTKLSKPKVVTRP